MQQHGYEFLARKVRLHSSLMQRHVHCMWQTWICTEALKCVHRTLCNKTWSRLPLGGAAKRDKQEAERNAAHASHELQQQQSTLR